MSVQDETTSAEDATIVPLTTGEAGRVVLGATENATTGQAVETDNRRIDHAGADERDRRNTRPSPQGEIDLSTGAARRIHADKTAEVGDLMDKIKWFTRRLFDLARDPEWQADGRDEVSTDVHTLGQQLRLVAEVIGDPDPARVTNVKAGQRLAADRRRGMSVQDMTGDRS